MLCSGALQLILFEGQTMCHPQKHFYLRPFISLCDGFISASGVNIAQTIQWKLLIRSERSGGRERETDWRGYLLLFRGFSVDVTQMMLVLLDSVSRSEQVGCCYGWIMILKQIIPELSSQFANLSLTRI